MMKLKEQKSLEIHASLNQNCTFFAGERLICQIKIVNWSAQKEKITSAHAFLDAQMLLNGEFYKSELFPSSCSSSSKKENLPFFSCALLRQVKKPLLSEELELLPEQHWTCRYSVVLPRTLPSSCKGKAFKVQYSLFLSFSREGFQPITLKFNFRVFSRGFIVGAREEPVFDPFRTLELDLERDFCLESSNDSLASQDAFELVKKQCKSSEFISLAQTRQMLSQKPLLPLFEQKMHPKILSSLTAESTSAKYFFEIKKEHSSFAKLDFPRKAYALGEEIVASLAFVEDALSTGNHLNNHLSSTMCFAVQVSLESWELVNGKFGNFPEEISAQKTRKVHFSQEYSCIFVQMLMLQIPLESHLIPSFCNKICSLRYEIRLEFKCCRANGAVDSSDQKEKRTFFEHQFTGVPECGKIWGISRQLSHDSLECLIPIEVLPNNSGGKELFLSSEIHINYPNEPITTQ